MRPESKAAMKEALERESRKLPHALDPDDFEIAWKACEAFHASQAPSDEVRELILISRAVVYMYLNAIPLSTDDWYELKKAVEKAESALSLKEER